MHVYKQVFEIMNSELNSLQFDYYLAERTFDPELEENITRAKDFRISYFSDSIICSIPTYDTKYDEWILTLFLSKLNVALSLLFAQGIVLRGGLAFGDLYHKDNYCVGPGLVEAHRLESKEAKYPLIKIAPLAMSDCQLIDTLVEKDSESGRYLSAFTMHFNSIEWSRDDDELLKLLLSQRVEFLKTAFPIIQKMISSNDVSIEEKGNWLSDKFNNLKKVTIEVMQLHNISTESIKKYVV